MKKKRSPGDRGINLLDSLDLEIMERLDGQQLGIMQLNEKMGLHHQSLKPHLDKLRDVKLINSQKQKRSPKIILSLPYKTLPTIKLLKKLKKSRL